MYSTTVVSFAPWLSKKKNCKGKLKKKNQISQGMNDEEHSGNGDGDGRCSGNDKNCNCNENGNDVYYPTALRRAQMTPKILNEYKYHAVFVLQRTG